MSDYNFLNFHTGYFDVCENVVVKCPKADAQRFIEILPKLRQFVVIFSMNNYTCRINLSDIEISINNEIKTHDFTNCVFKNGEMRMKYALEIAKYGYTNKKQILYDLNINQHGSVYKSRQTSVYESVLEYCILHIVWQILKYNTKFNILNKYTTKISLKCNGQTIKKFLVPELVCDQCLREDFLTIRPVKSSDSKLISVINSLYDVLEFVKSNQEKEKLIVFKGHGNYKSSFIKKDKPKTKIIYNL
ncbi:putative ORFan [Tupanvirus deep ocean]|uniref:ORFan n=2 Tax=Tupanvirus TaxID=2094720 RepID=A0AC62A746_9VIRU|nr:putative ORFan [Tupanvirus deep ocean]QKU33584.1 putative ORFan [Tupanvirus deep ocean]